MSRLDEEPIVVAEFGDRTRAEAAWVMLMEAGIPANVLGDPGSLGGSVVARIQVARKDAAEALRLLADPDADQ